MKTLSFNPALLERLVCPMTKGSLAWNANNGELISASAGLAYPVRDGIPVMLPSEARTIRAAIVQYRAPQT
ncbi:MAG: Trm112 family protein [Mesorhizobium sp.]|uniref:Trm112 family protein n=1 Tax=Mesorhizobium sp. TaxID=1871066 RepID=UPI001208FE35|nr:Trm112 family protein [Mesorhizobium sp.]TIR21942.1 MAG: Trm112 family protein [Mesorhizobium sp.]